MAGTPSDRGMTADPILLISTIADMLAGDRHVAIGAASPIPGAAALLAQAEAAHRMHVTILHSETENRFTEGSRELFDAACQGRIDAFFLGGVQIDGQANINLVGTGSYPEVTKRFAGSFGSALMYYAVPKVILFREEHSPRTLVERVDFISAPGSNAPGIWRPGGCHALVTGRAVFGFDAARARFRLDKLHPGETGETIRAATGFDFDPGTPQGSALPDPDRIQRLAEDVAPRVAAFYPAFAHRIWGVRT
ncbi:MAG: CoA-transferase [Pseudomonadota bacterium]